MEPEYIHIKGAREHNLDIDSLEIPKKKLVVFTGVSGSGKSSLAFDTLYAEGHRRYVESLSSYARQFLGQMEKPRYEQIRGLSPTIAIEQKAASSNPRSTVGTITEISDFLRVLYARVGVQHCPCCDRVVERLSTDQVAARLRRMEGRVLLLAPLVTHRKGTHRQLLAGYRKKGFLRVRIDGKLERLDRVLTLRKHQKHTIELVVDRITPARVSASRLAESVAVALQEGDGVMWVLPLDTADTSPSMVRFSRKRYCAHCDLALPKLSPQSFSFNSPLGMCSDCNGLGRTMEMDPELVVPNGTLSIRQGAIKPLAGIMERQSGLNYSLFLGLERDFGLDLDRPWRALSKKQKNLVLYGIGDQRIAVDWNAQHTSGKIEMRFEGILNTLMRRYRETQSEAMRRYYATFFADQLCRSCGGGRLRPESHAVRVGGKSLVAVSGMAISEARAHFRTLALAPGDAPVAGELLKEINARLDFLCAVGLAYLTLDRLGPSLSGGEAQRIRLASQLGSELSGVMYVLDEPSIGLHQRDNLRLIDTLHRLRDSGNTVIVVEHDRQTIEQADHVVDFGPGAGEAGGKVVFCGTPRALRRRKTLTGQYLAGKRQIPVPAARRTGHGVLRVEGAAFNNLKKIDVDFPLGTMIAVTGVSGAGKSSLVTGICYPALRRRLHGSTAPVGRHRTLRGAERIDKVIHIDQSPIGRTPRSNAATYTKVFDEIRAIFAALPESRTRGYKPGRFSFNVAGGRCEACKGDGVKKVEMHFLADVYVPCQVCRAQRYNQATLEVRYRGLNIAEVLDLSVQRALALFESFPKVKRILTTLMEVGLDYLKLGQPAPTLSGGEAQRVKLSRELAKRSTGNTFYVLDEPTTGLHFEDIRRLLAVLQRLVDGGNTVIVIEHNLDVIKCADHVIDLGPEGGAQGGRVVAAGTPEALTEVVASHTGRFLERVFSHSPPTAKRKKPAKNPANKPVHQKQRHGRRRGDRRRPGRAR